MKIPSWWKKPRTISLLVPEVSWVLPYAKEVANYLSSNGDKANLCHDSEDIPTNGITFFFSWLKIIPPELLDRSYLNLVIHASDLPKGRGFSPMPWQIIQGNNEIVVCLFEAVSELDAGPVVFRDKINFKGHELIDELRKKLGEIHINLVTRYLDEVQPTAGVPQEKNVSQHYKRRTNDDSELDLSKTIEEQFNLLRTVDNKNYPAFFDYQEHRYKLVITKMKKEKF